jgi:hypothetical protein
MSNKIKKQLAETDKKYVIEDIEMQYLVDIDNVQRGSDHWFNQLKTNYLQQIAIRLGYLPEDQLEFTIDLKDKSKELTVKRVK